MERRGAEGADNMQPLHAGSKSSVHIMRNTGRASSSTTSLPMQCACSAIPRLYVDTAGSHTPAVSAGEACPGVPSQWRHAINGRRASGDAKNASDPDARGAETGRQSRSRTTPGTSPTTSASLASIHRARAVAGKDALQSTAGVANIMCGICPRGIALSVPPEARASQL